MPTYLLYLDDAHLEDPLFVQSMARLMHRRNRLPPCAMVHGSGGQVERLLEAEGLFPATEDGVVRPETPEEAALAERGMRAATHTIVGTLVDEIIYAVGFQGADRGLLQRRDDGTLAAGRTDWIETLIDQQAIPVISTLVRDVASQQLVPVPLHDAALTLAHALDRDVVLVFFTASGRPGLLAGDGTQPDAPLDAVPEDALSAPATLRAAVTSGLSALLTSPVGLFGGSDIQGTWIVASR